jgi:DNA repair protein SbcD/Mre11
MVTFLHTADVHLDRAFSGMGMSQGMAVARREELRDVVRRLVELAKEMRVDALTIGGDLFEHERATMDTGNFLRQQFERVQPARVFVAPGNHDPYVPDSLYRRIEWPGNVTIFRTPSFQAVEAASGVTIWGAGHDGPSVRRNLLDGFRVSGQGRHILLFHGSDVGSVPEGKPAHAPFRPEDVTATGADFAMLGHYHGARVREGAGGFAYPGSPEALDFSEAGTHQVFRLDVSEAAVTAELVPFGRVEYATQRIDVGAMASSDEVREAIAGLPLGGAIVRLVMEGVLQADVELDITALYNGCAERFAYLDIVDRTEPGYDFQQLAEESTTKGVFVRLMLGRMERLAGEEWEGARDALVLGLRAFDRKELTI